MLSVDDILALNPCPPFNQRSTCEEYYGARSECGINDFLEMNIKDDQKIFVILRGNLVSQSIQESLKAVYLSRINKMRAPRLWREANVGDCAVAAHAAQLHASQVFGASSKFQRQEAINNEAAWQLQKLLEAINV